MDEPDERVEQRESSDAPSASSLPMLGGASSRDDTASDMSPGMARFVESMGRYFDEYRSQIGPFALRNAATL